MFSENYFSYLICNDSEVDTPVPIPNTEVKHFYAEDSVCENRTLQIFFCAKKEYEFYILYISSYSFSLFSSIHNLYISTPNISDILHNVPIENV